MRAFGVVTARIYRFLYNRSPTNRFVVDLAELRPDDRVLEIGCGPGTAVVLAAERLGAHQVAAVDPSATFVDIVRRRVPGADVRIAGAETLPFDDGAFTVIWSVASLHHWSDQEAGLAVAAAKLAPGGRLIIVERLLDESGHGITPQRTTEVVALLSSLGLGDVQTTEHRVGRKTMMAIRAQR